MYYGGRPEPRRPVMHALLVGIGVLAGVGVGFIGYLLATVFPHMLRVALPGMSNAWFLALWIAALCVPILALRTVALRGEGAGARPYAIAAIVTIVGLFVIDASGVHRIFPWGTRFFIAPMVAPPDATRLTR